MNLSGFWDEISEKLDLVGRIWQSSSDGSAFPRFLEYFPREIGVERRLIASSDTKKDRIEMQFSPFKVRLSSCHSGQALFTLS